MSQLFFSATPSKAKFYIAPVMVIVGDIPPLAVAGGLALTEVEKFFPGCSPVIHGPIGMAEDLERRVHIGKAGRARKIDGIHDEVRMTAWTFTNGIVTASDGPYWAETCLM